MDTSYCLKCKTKTNNVNPVNKIASNGKPYISSECDTCGSKKSTFTVKKKTISTKFIK